MHKFNAPSLWVMGSWQYTCGSIGKKINIILLCISISSLHSKRCISELPAHTHYVEALIIEASMQRV